ncbi:Endonuclease/exonuclease/phosphatase [Arabidopsis thaliana x Arabidopsis arenosa]|uniref:Endonuclease/exonuclease/phosphatase n=1 Tax=Arabidopsis thaliana x Arabidopsis arenosa TaxID=1240361 RepID=A0A8T2AXP3_9BRAS|nr:Endonuclease/exonuclease/phosphatase [Arabidopsis thaliana x Arabidopsis arenosa]
MSSAMDRAMLAMSLEEEDVPLEMPDLPEYSSSKENELSLVGRLLNPECQSMKNLIRNMPRKWQKVGRVRGVALSKEKFQFFFNCEYDLVDVLEKGVHTFDEWTVVVDRWYEVPPDNYLQFTPLWIQIWNLPINYYTHKAITLLGEQIGQVQEVVFDKDTPQIEEFVRVKVLFDVSRPLRRSKVVNLPKGGTANVFFEYERVQKRCYECQRMTHEKDVCPFLIKKRQDAAEAKRAGGPTARPKRTPFLKESDPLFGVLSEDQVGIDPNTGRPRIAPVVLEGMRQYLRVSSEEEKLLRIDKVKLSVGEVEKDPLAQKSILRLEPMPIFHSDVNKGKGHVFSYEPVCSSGSDCVDAARVPQGQDNLVMDVAPLEVVDTSWLVEPRSHEIVDGSASFLALSQPFQNNSTVFSPSLFEAGSSGIGMKKVKARKRPSKINRQPKLLSPNLVSGLRASTDVLKKGGIAYRPMSIISWNCQGLGRSQDLAIPRLKELRKKHFPEILFLMETMNKRDILVDLQVWMGYERVWTVEPIGKSGGLALFCKKNVQIDVLHMDKNLIDCQVQFGEKNFFLSCVYGEPDSSKRSGVWERICRLGISRKDRWCMVGDFNAILHNGEKIGGPRRSDSYFKPFSEVLVVCDMVELSSQGNKYTWAGRRGDHWVQCRLDRAFGNKDWYEHFPASNQTFLDLRGSDHRPVLLSLISSQDSYRGQFRFDRRFLFKPEKVFELLEKKNNMSARDKIQKCEIELEKTQSEVWPCLQKIRVLKKELVVAYREEEQYWHQKSRQKWLRCGNRNSGFFHASVNDNRSRKRIDKLKDHNGIFQRSEAAKGQVAASYFQDLFKSSNPASFSDWFQGFLPKVSEEMNLGLTAKVSAEEIKEAVFSIKHASAPGPDGMSGLFFQRYWSTVGTQVTTEVQNFFEFGVMPVEWNFTHLCLIPKIHHPEEMVDLRPISLCSVLYKIISKILVKRLQPLLPNIVSVNQSAFVSDRLITDNILVAHEVIHGLRTHPAISSEFMAIKSDMSKAYDRLEWSFLRALLSALGFHQRWVDWVMICVSSVTYSVLINDQPFGLITPQRGLRQGDPLSPFLFVLCTEGLTHLMNKAQQEGKIEGIKFSDEGPEVHHLLFADDSLFMCKADNDQSRVLQQILSVYGDATGQSINLNKSSITFGAKVNHVVKIDIQIRLGIFKEGGAGTYLGLPECFSGSKIALLDYIKDRLKVKLSGWFARHLSQGGKEVLLKSVALAMPVFAMSCFKLPKTSCDNLAAAMADFWWSAEEHSRKVHWVSWEKLCLPKHLGGLGFRDIKRFNQALLAKQAWKILQEPDCLLAKLMKSRYFPTKEFLNAPVDGRPSFAWRSILHGRELLEKGISKHIGNGSSVNVWIDPWIEDEDEGMRAPMRKNYFFDVCLKVNSLIDPISRTWDFEALVDHFFEEDIERIKKIRPVSSRDDFYTWKYNKSGDFSVKSAYWLSSKDFVDEGFESGEIFSNFHHLLVNRKNRAWPEEVRKIFPWILWRLWTNRNAFAFEGKSLSAPELVLKSRDDFMEWCEAQVVEPEEVLVGENFDVNQASQSSGGERKAWQSPAPDWLKCNVGSSWSKTTKLAGAAWVVRDNEGLVLINGRRSFVNVKDAFEAAFLSLLWGIESMKDHRFYRVLFAFQETTLVGIVNRPKAWPSFRYQAQELQRLLVSGLEWKMVVEAAAANRGASLISQSVINDFRLHSYVATGYPSWLLGVFEDERPLSSVFV